MLATGAEPVRLPVPGADDPERAAPCAAIEDSERLRERPSATGRGVIVVGSGFIGCEAAASLAMRGARRDAGDRRRRVPQDARLGDEAGARIAGWLEALGRRAADRAPRSSAIERRSGPRASTAPAASAGRGRRRGAGGRACGRAPALAEAAGLATRGRRASLTDAAMRTSAPRRATRPATSRSPTTPRAGPAAARSSTGARRSTTARSRGACWPAQDAEWDNAPGFWSTIGEHTLKYVAWGDGFDEVRLDDHGDGAFTVWYGRAGGARVGVLAHERDEDYERGRELVEAGAPLP